MAIYQTLRELNVLSEVRSTISSLDPPLLPHPIPQSMNLDWLEISLIIQRALFHWIG